MVLLTMTPSVVRALAVAGETSSDGLAKLQQAGEPSLARPAVGNPISHGQLIGLSTLLKNISHAHADPVPSTLAALLSNSAIYTPPPPPKKTQTPEYTALMARLRAQEEARSYERMLHPPPTRESFTQRFPRAPAPFSLGATAPLHDDDDDDVSYEEVHRQIILIINILISIVCVAVFIWVAARHWSVGKRLGLSMGGALGIAVAEVAVYSGYVRKVREAKRKEKKKPEIKEIVKSWVLDRDGEKDGSVAKGNAKEMDGMRFRKGKHR